jgi:putative CocE/NonD family hydrolase
MKSLLPLVLLAAGATLAACDGATGVAVPDAASVGVGEDPWGVATSIMLPMRDGVKLHTDILVPVHLKEPDRKFPTVIDRSPYGGTGTELLADIYLPFHAATVTQDFRGTRQSEGNFSLWHTATNDTADTIAWIRKQPWSDGRIYTMGASADGIASLLVPLDPSANLSGQFVIWATADAYNTIYPGGAYRAALIDGWLDGTVRKDQAEASIQLVRSKESPIDEWWDVVSVKGRWDMLTAPAVFWAG